MRRLRLLFGHPLLGSGASTAAVAAVLLVAVGAWQIVRSRADSLDHAAENLRVLTHALAQHAARTIEAADLTLEDVVRQRAVGTTENGSLGEFLRRRASRLAQVRNFAVTRADGSWSADAVGAKPNATSADRPYYRFHRDHDDRSLHIGEPLTSQTTGQPSIPLSRRLEDPDGSFAGVVVATLAPEYLAEIYRQVRNGESGTVAVWLEDGHLLLRYPAVLDPPRDLAASARALFTGNAGLSRSVSPIDGVERLFAYEHVEGLPLIVSASVSVDDALAGWRRGATTQACVIGAAALLLSLLGGGLEAHRRRIGTLLVASGVKDQRYRMLAENTTDVIVQLDPLLVSRFVSTSAQAMLGFAPEELQGKPFCTLVHAKDVDKVRGLAEQLFSGALPEGRTVVTFRTRHRIGRWVWTEAALTVVREGDGSAPSLVCSLRDVTERRRVARDLERAKSAAEAAGRAKSDFVANMSHELRTPLTGMLGVLDLMRRNPSLSADQQRLLGIAGDSGHALLSIVNDVLDFSKIEAGQLTIETVPFSAADLVASCRDLVAETLRAKPVELQTTVTPAVPRRLLGDPMRLRQVLLNLMLNAVKFTERGVVAVTLDYRGDTGHLHAEVSDTGIGIPADSDAVLFARFAQADSSTTRRFGGTGLGLAICKRIVDLMGGQITARSRPEGGSVFAFAVPLREAGEERNSPVAASPAPVPAGARLLLAEDHETNAEIIAAMLSARGYAVQVVGDGAAAVERLAGAEPPDLVLMDIQMPVMDGLAATAAIRAHEAKRGARRVPIIGLTANALAEDAERCRAGGMDGHVSKPVVWPDLFAAIDGALAASRQEAQAA